MKRLFLTAFGPFPDCPVNPTGRLARAVVAALFGEEPVLPGWCVEVVEIPTDWSAPADLIAALRGAEPAPDLVISLGVRRASLAVCVERVAFNEAAVGKADASGKAPAAHKLDKVAPERLEGWFHRSSLGEVVARVRDAGHPVVFSDDAGRYLCNALFFHLLNDLADEPGPRVGFVHVPHIRGVTAPPLAKGALDEPVLVDALVALVRGWCEAVARG